MYLSHFPLPVPTVRTIDEMRSVLFAPTVSHPHSLYSMYRDVAKTETDRSWLHSHAIRYDITIIPPAHPGGEYVKTKGHYHPENPAGTRYPELYEVIDGVAHFLLQKKTLEHIALVKATKGDIILIPPGYGHVTINPSEKETLIMSNLVSTAFESEYAFYETMHGAAWYELVGNILLHNPHYPEVPSVQEITAPSSPLKQFGKKPSLYDYVGDTAIAGLLNHPEKYPAIGLPDV